MKQKEKIVLVIVDEKKEKKKEKLWTIDKADLPCCDNLQCWPKKRKKNFFAQYQWHQRTSESWAACLRGINESTQNFVISEGKRGRKTKTKRFLGGFFVAENECGKA